MCPRRGKITANSASTSNKPKQQERQARAQEKKNRNAKGYLKDDENAAEFDQQLRAFNLELRDIVGDGNCLFRSFADQMDGDQSRHAQYRAEICDFMRNNRADFEPFIVDQSFDEFISSLHKNGTYGGNECLVAFSRLYDTKICIHQLNQPVWTVCFSNSPKHEIHISYHNFEHYSSVRKLGDNTSSSANIRQAMTTCDVSIVNDKKKKTENDCGGACAAPSVPLFDEYDIDYVQSRLSNTVDRELIRETLVENDGDIDGTIAHMLAFDLPSSPCQSLDIRPSLERIMTITGVHDIDIVEQSFAVNNSDMDLTVEALLGLRTTDHENSKMLSNDEEEKQDENQPSSTTKETAVTKTKKPLPNRQVKIDKKKAKKERATAKRRAEILVSANTVKQSEEQPVPPNNEQEQRPPANMEFILI